MYTFYIDVKIRHYYVQHSSGPAEQSGAERNGEWRVESSGVERAHFVAPIRGVPGRSHGSLIMVKFAVVLFLGLGFVRFVSD